MKRPKVIMHNTVSLDGSFTGFDVDMGLHYQVAARYQVNAHLIGSNTLKTGAEAEVIPPENDTDFTKPERSDNLPYWAIVDSRGIGQGLLHTCRSFEYCRDVIALVSPKTGLDYVNYLEERNYDYVVSGTEHVDFHQAFEVLTTKYDVRTILVDSGPTLNSVLLSLGLIDEISLLLVPVLVGRESGDLLAHLNLGQQNIHLESLSHEDLADGIVLLRYRVLYTNI